MLRCIGRGKGAIEVLVASAYEVLGIDVDMLGSQAQRELEDCWRWAAAARELTTVGLILGEDHEKDPF